MDIREQARAALAGADAEQLWIMLDKLEAQEELMKAVAMRPVSMLRDFVGTHNVVNDVDRRQLDDHPAFTWRLVDLARRSVRIELVTAEQVRTQVHAAVVEQPWLLDDLARDLPAETLLRLVDHDPANPLQPLLLSGQGALADALRLALVACAEGRLERSGALEALGDEHAGAVFGLMKAAEKAPGEVLGALEELGVADQVVPALTDARPAGDGVYLGTAADGAEVEVRRDLLSNLLWLLSRLGQVRTWLRLDTRDLRKVLRQLTDANVLLFGDRVTLTERALTLVDGPDHLAVLKAHVDDGAVQVVSDSLLAHDEFVDRHAGLLQPCVATADEQLQRFIKVLTNGVQPPAADERRVAWNRALRASGGALLEALGDDVAWAGLTRTDDGFLTSIDDEEPRPVTANQAAAHVQTLLRAYEAAVGASTLPDAAFVGLAADPATPVHHAVAAFSEEGN